MRVCVFAVCLWQCVSSSFVFPRESVKYPGCCPDLGEGAVRHSGQMLRFTTERQVSARSCPAPSHPHPPTPLPGGTNVNRRLGVCVVYCRSVNNRRTGCIWNGVVAQGVDVVDFLIYHMNVGQAADYHLLVWICSFTSLITLKGRVLKLAVNQNPRIRHISQQSLVYH